MKVYAWLIDLIHRRKNCPPGMISGWVQKVTEHRESFWHIFLLLLLNSQYLVRPENVRHHFRDRLSRAGFHALPPRQRAMPIGQRPRRVRQFRRRGTSTVTRSIPRKHNFLRVRSQGRRSGREPRSGSSERRTRPPRGPVQRGVFDRWRHRQGLERGQDRLLLGLQGFFVVRQPLGRT